MIRSGENAFTYWHTDIQWWNYRTPFCLKAGVQKRGYGTNCYRNLSEEANGKTRQYWTNCYRNLFDGKKEQLKEYARNCSKKFQENCILISIKDLEMSNKEMLKFENLHEKT